MSGRLLASIILLSVFMTGLGCASRKAGPKTVPKEVLQGLPSPDEEVPYTDPPRQIKPVQPEYPLEALEEEITGTVWLNVLVDTTGTVTDVRLVKDSGKNVGFEESAERAARATRWSPAKENGRPVALRVTYKVDFSLKK